MTEERLLEKIQQKKLEEIDKRYEDRKKYRECLLECTNKSSAIMRRLVFIDDYLIVESYLFLLFFSFFGLGLTGYLTTDPSLVHSISKISVVFSALGCGVVACIIRESFPVFGFTDRGIYEEIQLVNNEIASLELEKNL